MLAADGRYVMAGVNADGRILGPMLPFLRLIVRSRFDQRARIARAVENTDDLRTLAELVEAGSLRPAIDRRFILAEAADAMRFVEEGRAAGKIGVCCQLARTRPDSAIGACRSARQSRMTAP